MATIFYGYSADSCESDLFPAIVKAYKKAFEGFSKEVEALEETIEKKPDGGTIIHQKKVMTLRHVPEDDSEWSDHAKEWFFKEVEKSHRLKEVSFESDDCFESGFG